MLHRGMQELAVSEPPDNVRVRHEARYVSEVYAGMHKCDVPMYIVAVVIFARRDDSSSSPKVSRRAFAMQPST